MCAVTVTSIASELQSRLLDFSSEFVVQILWQAKKNPEFLCQTKHFLSVIEVLIVQKNYYSSSYTDTSNYNSSYILIKFICASFLVPSPISGAKLGFGCLSSGWLALEGDDNMSHVSIQVLFQKCVMLMSVVSCSLPSIPAGVVFLHSWLFCTLLL